MMTWALDRSNSNDKTLLYFAY